MLFSSVSCGENEGGKLKPFVSTVCRVTLTQRGLLRQWVELCMGRNAKALDAQRLWD